MNMGFDYYNKYYQADLFDKEQLDLFVSVGFLSQTDEDRILTA